MIPKSARRFSERSCANKKLEWDERSRKNRPALGMGENILRRPAGEVQPYPVGEKAKASGREVGATLAREHGVEPFLQGMEMQDVGCGVSDLRIGQLIGTPIGGLLLLRHLDPQHFAHEILETVLVGIGA